MGNEESHAENKGAAQERPETEQTAKDKRKQTGSRNRSRRPSSRAPATKREIMETFGSRELTRASSSDNDGFVPPSHFMGLKRTKSDMGVHEDVIDALSNRLGSRRVSISNDTDNGDDQISKVVAEAAARVKAEDPMNLSATQPTHGIKQNVSNLLNKYRTQNKMLRKKSNIVVGSSRNGMDTETGHSGLKESTSKTNQWSSREEDLLKVLVDKHGTDWKLIAEHLPGRSHTQCQNRWNRMLKPGIRKGTWTTEEDEKLITLVKDMPKKNWGDISALIEGRSAKQCRERWCYNLDPSINKNVWTPTEDQALIKAQGEMGNRWAHIASLLPGRTENAVKTRFKSIMRAKKREWSPQEDDIILKMHAQLGSRWDTIAQRLPNRTKNAVKTRYRVLGKGVTRTTPEIGAPNQILHIEPTNATLPELTQKVAQEHKQRGGSARISTSATTKPGNRRQKAAPMRHADIPMEVPIVEDAGSAMEGESSSPSLEEYRRFVSATEHSHNDRDQGVQHLLSIPTDQGFRGAGNVADVVAAASAAAAGTHQNSLLSRINGNGNGLFGAEGEESLEDAFTSVHAGQQVDDELIDFLDMWNQGSNVENTIM